MAPGIGGSSTAGGPGAQRKPRGSRPYRKYHPLPAIALVTVLCLTAAVIWIKVAVDKSTIDDEIRCHPDAAPPPGVSFTPLPRGAIDGTEPLPPGKVPVQVRNASSTLGQASRTTQKLEELGFTQLGKPSNDPAYKEREADCHGQIRFGPNGRAAARTISLLDPCLELIKTNRKDASVDLVVGTDFRGIHLSSAARKVLNKLNAWAQHHQATEGGEQAAAAKPSINPKLLHKARSGQC